MGILNITPDSFFAGSRTTTETTILTTTEKMLHDGAAILDIGGYSSRPGAADVSVEEEITRVVGAVTLVLKNFPTAIISIDTFRAEVARQAVQAGASIINDISAGELDANMFQTVAQLKVPYIAMHMRGTPATMNSLTQYNHLVKDIAHYFAEKVSALTALGIHDVILDPGFGFAKTIDQNFELLNHLDYFQMLGKPILAGLSRKSMIWKTLDIKPEDALPGTTALNMAALLKRANILRVHDVREAVQTVKLFSKLTLTGR